MPAPNVESLAGVILNIKKDKYAKCHEPNWSKDKRTVVGIRGNQYFIPTDNTHDLLLRHEIV